MAGVTKPYVSAGTLVASEGFLGVRENCRMFIRSSACFNFNFSTRCHTLAMKLLRNFVEQMREHSRNLIIKFGFLSMHVYGARYKL